MRSERQIPKPANWQDFERLCVKLWGEVWSCRNEIVRHGRNGQAQMGVDIYAMPKGEMGYWGIQCKAKDEYVGAELTTVEIDREIANAMTFEPKLERLIVATTANSDVELERHVRIRNQENRVGNGFGILLFSWQNIVALLEEYPAVLNWYLAEKSISSAYAVNVYLSEPSRTLYPRYLRRVTRHWTQLEIDKLPLSERMQMFNRPFLNSSLLDRSLLLPNGYGPRNHARCELEIVVENVGALVLEDWKLNFSFEEGTFKEVDGDRGGSLEFSRRENQPLIQKDSFTISSRILPKHGISAIRIDYEFLARDFDTTGSLLVHIEPRYEEKVNHVIVDATEVRADVVLIEEKLK